MPDKMEMMRGKVAVLSEAAKAYYQESLEIMPNIEYDKLYDELAALEKETGIVLSGSPTVTVGYETLEGLPKEKHESRMLSLDKTKDVGVLKTFLGDREALLSWKLDGLTVVLTYAGGKLQKAVTRGNGEVGEVITGNAKVFCNIPLSIAFEGELVLRGEAVIKYSDFEKINASIAELEAKYKNPRNLCSGSVRQLNNKITAERNVRFYAFSLVKAEGVAEIQNSRLKEMEWLAQQGFEVVESLVVDQRSIEDAVAWFSAKVAESDLPSDGLVLLYDDIAYGKSLGNTSKFPRDAIAFKWRDEIKETELEEIEWSASRTGLINPIAVFKPVELEGTTVSRASVHNISILKQLELGIGDEVTVYKANMIIPQIADNLTRSGNVMIPEQCPVCGGKTTIKSDSGVETLYCTNDTCAAKQVKFFTHFVSRDAMNIEGLSEATLEKWIAEGIIESAVDLFHLKQHKEKIVLMEGMGEKSYANVVASIDKARKTTTVRLLYALGIPNIGIANAKAICKACGHDWERIKNLSKEALLGIYGIGDVMADGYVDYFIRPDNREMVEKVAAELQFEDAPEERVQTLEDKVFVITGSLNHFENREALQAMIEKLGGKVTSSVTLKTHYLINNDILSGSSKNKKAKELNVQIITEDDFLELIKQ